MSVTKAKIVGYKVKKDSEYRIYFCTAEINGNGAGSMTLQFSSKESLKLGSEVYVSYTTKQLEDGKVFRSWEYVRF